MSCNSDERISARAHEISAIEFLQHGTPDPDEPFAMLHFVDTMTISEWGDDVSSRPGLRRKPLRIDGVFYFSHKPKVGGYILEYPNGSLSYRPILFYKETYKGALESARCANCGRKLGNFGNHTNDAWFCSKRCEDQYLALNGALSKSECYRNPDETEELLKLRVAHARQVFTEPQVSIRDYETGYCNGHSIGHRDGYEEGHRVGLKRGYDRGYGEGHSSGFKSGHEYSLSVNGLEYRKDAERYRFAAEHLILVGGEKFGWPIHPAGKEEWDDYIDEVMKSINL